jgi:rubrerythrin
MSKAIFSFLVAVCLAAPVAADNSPSSWPETVAVMRAALQEERTAHLKYLSFSKRAGEEKYPRIAYLFSALAFSEGIHARNFLAVLKDLNDPGDVAAVEFPLKDTKDNIRNSSTVELEEIDVRYPGFLDRLAPERRDDAISSLTHAWRAEKQHRDLIATLAKGSGALFGFLAALIEGKPVEYFVCLKCGSTLSTPEMPKRHDDPCPICGNPVSEYEKVEPPG